MTQSNKAANQPILWSECYKSKVIVPERAAAFAAELKQQGKSIATLNGSFDLLHAGHLQIIYEASRLADVLIVALNTDDSIRQYKGPKRPIISLEFRLQMMAALEFVNYLTWFDETDPRNILSLIKPDIHVNGSEYGEDCIEAETVKANGGRLHLVARIPGLATSDIIKKIQQDTAICG